MIVKSLKLKNYRNYELLNIEFDKATNIFYGDNAQGKTNILEAVYLSGMTRSHRGTKDRDLIRFEEEEAHIETTIEKNGIPYQIDMHLKKNSPKGIAINKMPIRKATELFGLMNFVFFSPEDLNIIKNGPAERRRFMDLELSQLDKVYLKDLAGYNRIVNQRNKLLKDYAFGNQKELLDTLDVWDMQLVIYGNRVIERRRKFIKEINTIIYEIHQKLTGGRETIHLSYESGCGVYSLEDALRRNRERDIRMKSTSVGPHRDDICFIAKHPEKDSEEIDIRKFGSQGQQRTAALSLKLAELNLIKEETGESAILLLDDVMSELDITRQEFLIKSLSDIQLFITTTEITDSLKEVVSKGKIYTVEKGQIKL